MARNNAINKDLPPVQVADGGTGQVTLTDGSVLVGSGSSPITPITVGTTGQLMAGVTSSDPAFASSLDGDFTFTSATASVNRTVTVSNTDNTNTSSHATVQLTVGGSTAGDSNILFLGGNPAYAQGIDNNVSDRYAISPTIALGTNDILNISSLGSVQYPRQSAFRAEQTGSQNNITGDGTVATLVTSSTAFDLNSDYNGTTTFTAPRTGTYFFSDPSGLGGTNNAAFTGYKNIILSGGNNPAGWVAPVGTLFRPTSTFTLSAEYMVYLTAGDTVHRQVAIAGATKVVDSFGTWCGYLVG